MASKKKPLTSGRISKLAANPGTRAALADKYLSSSQLKQRQMNQRLNAPVVEGSSLTNRDLSHQADAAATLHFGGNPVQQAQQVGKDQNDWYAQYQAAANQLKTDLGNNATQATTAAQNTTAAVGQLGAATAAGTGDVASDAGKASVVRQALSGGFGNLFAAQGQNSKDYGAKIADLVVPGQKLTAQNRNAGDVRDAKGQLAAFLEKYKGDAITGEATSAQNAAKMDLAYKTLGLDASKAATTATNETTRTQETIRHNKAAEKQDAASVKQRAQQDAQKINSYGYTNAQWAGMTVDQRRKIINSGKGGKDSTYLAPASQNTFKRTFDAAKTTATKLNLGVHYGRDELRGLLKNGRQAQTVFVDENGKPIPDVYSIAAAQKKNPHARPVAVPAVKPITDEAVLSAVLDTVLDGHLSQYTIKKLHQAGIKVNALGVPTKPTTATKVNSTLSSVGQMLGQIGGG